MPAKIVGLLAVLSLGTSSETPASNLYFLSVPVTDGYIVFGSITTDGASTLSNGSVVDWAITMISPTSARYILTPSNSSFSWSGVRASLAGLNAGLETTDQVRVASNALCPTGGPLFECYGIAMFNGPVTGHRLFYEVLGFGQTDEVLAMIPAPFATRAPSMELPILWLALRVEATGAGSGLLEEVTVAEENYAANDGEATCRALSGVEYQAREQRKRGLGESASNRVIGYSQAIRTAIACKMCG